MIRKIVSSLRHVMVNNFFGQIHIGRSVDNFIRATVTGLNVEENIFDGSGLVLEIRSVLPYTGHTLNLNTQHINENYYVNGHILGEMEKMILTLEVPKGIEVRIGSGVLGNVDIMNVESLKVFVSNLGTVTADLMDNLSLHASNLCKVDIGYAYNDTFLEFTESTCGNVREIRGNLSVRVYQWSNVDIYTVIGNELEIVQNSIGKIDIFAGRVNDLNISSFFNGVVRYGGSTMRMIVDKPTGHVFIGYCPLPAVSTDKVHIANCQLFN